MSDDRDYTIGSDNVFSDLDLPDAEELPAKAKLVRAIDLILTEKGWKERRASAAIGIDEIRLSALLRGEFQEFTLGQFFKMLNALDYEVAIEIAPRNPSHEIASVTIALKNSVEPGSVAAGV